MASSKAKQRHDGAKLGTLATRIAERFAGARDELGIDRLVSELGDVQRYDIVAALKELENAGAGELMPARAGQKARFAWTAGVPLVATKTPLPTTTIAGNKEDHVVQRWKTSTSRVMRAPSSSTPSAPVPTVDKSVRAPTQGASPATAAASATLEHVFHLRPGFQATIRLPADVTRSEVDRFCQFLQAIPFERGEAR